MLRMPAWCSAGTAATAAALTRLATMAMLRAPCRSIRLPPKKAPRIKGMRPAAAATPVHSGLLVNDRTNHGSATDAMALPSSAKVPEANSP